MFEDLTLDCLSECDCFAKCEKLRVAWKDSNDVNYVGEFDS